MSIHLRSLVLAAALALPGADGPLPVHYELRVRIAPEEHRLVAEAAITNVPLEAGTATFRLARELAVRGLDPGLEVVAVVEGESAATASGEGGGPLAVTAWQVRRRDGAPLAPGAAIRLAFEGIVHHPLESEGEEYARSFAQSSGLIDEQGVVLSGSTWWIPAFADRLLTFELAVDLPAGWDAVSQGARTRHELVAGAGGGERRAVAWSCPHPMEEIYLVAAPFHAYAREAGPVATYAFLREADEALANRYLDVTGQYIDMYGRLIGPYPFAKFALVENFWETGYGMPSFTLLGPTVIRLPFILHSSYPHEILHNWWGNGVYVDWESGNWCEGLTAYLADHLIKEGRGEGEAYRRDTLDKYRSYVGSAKDFPLTQFRSRHSSSTEAVGYGKTLMLFHMLRRRMGDEAFSRFLGRVYTEGLFRRASFADLAATASAVAGEDLGAFFRQWVERTGAPFLAATFLPAAGGAGELVLRQTQPEEPYDLAVPIAVTREGRGEAEEQVVVFAGREARVRLGGDPPVARIDVDPRFDVFRRLHREEIPPTLGGLFGAEQVTLVVPDAGRDPLAADWLAFAEGWRASAAEGLAIVRAGEIDALPAGRSVWILGAENPWREAIRPALAARGVESAPAGGDCFAYAVRHPAGPEHTVGWIGGGTAAALPGLARKLPHYGKYSFLRFTGDEPTNVEKGQWSGAASPLVWMARPAVEPSGLAPRAPLAVLAPVFDEEALRAHVAFLAAPEREGRGAGSAGLRAAEEHVARALAAAGLEGGAPDGGFVAAWDEPGGPDGRPVRLANVIGVLPGTNPAFAGQSVVVGAHYDHLGMGWPDVHAGDKGKLHPGADDNASGVAALLELARSLGGSYRTPRTIVFVAFGGEEWGRKGSLRYLATMERWPAAKIHSMVNLDTVGRRAGRPLTLLGTGTATEWMHFAFGVGFETGVKYTLVPDDPGGSDQKSFQDAGVPAIQLFSGAHEDYHRPSDTIEKLDFPGLREVCAFTRALVVALAEWEKPFTTTLRPAAPPAAGGAADTPPAGRAVTLGTVPDFAYAGPGYRTASITPGSPAAEAGLAAGDVLLAIDGAPIADLRTYSALLKAHSPGDRIRVRFRRGEEELEVEAILRAR
ncbi:MAG: M20/M25/M40 family metallo-hydrolase [Planctomycetota bacterium]